MVRTNVNVNGLLVSRGISNVNIFMSKQTPAVEVNPPLYLLKGDGILEHSLTPPLQHHIVGIQRNTAT